MSSSVSIKNRMQRKVFLAPQKLTPPSTNRHLIFPTPSSISFEQFLVFCLQSPLKPVAIALKKLWEKTPALPPDAQISSSVSTPDVKDYPGPGNISQAPIFQSRPYEDIWNTSCQSFTPHHEVYELPDQLAVVIGRSDIRLREHWRRHLDVGEVIGAGDYDASREDNELSSAIGFSNAVLEMLDAENVAGLEDKEAIAGGGGVGNGSPDVDRKSVSNGPPSDFIFMDVPIDNPTDGMSASLNTPFSLPGPISQSFEQEPKLFSQAAPPSVSQDPKTRKVVPALVPTPTQKATLSRNLHLSDPRFRVLSPQDIGKRDLKREESRKSPAPKRFCCF